MLATLDNGEEMLMDGYARNAGNASDDGDAGSASTYCTVPTAIVAASIQCCATPISLWNVLNISIEQHIQQLHAKHQLEPIANKPLRICSSSSSVASAQHLTLSSQCGLPRCGAPPPQIQM